MTEVKPATDPLMGMDAQEWAREFLRIWSGRWSEVDEGLMISWFANAIMRGFDEGRRRTDSEKDAEIARLKTDKANQRTALDTLEILYLERGAEIAHLKAEVERLIQKQDDDPAAAEWFERLKAEATALREAIGVLTTLHPTMVMDPANPIGMAQEIHAHVTAEEARLKAEVERLSADRCHQCNGDGQILERDPAFETVTMNVPASLLRKAAQSVLELARWDAALADAKSPSSRFPDDKPDVYVDGYEQAVRTCVTVGNEILEVMR